MLHDTSVRFTLLQCHDFILMCVYYYMVRVCVCSSQGKNPYLRNFTILAIFFSQVHTVFFRKYELIFKIASMIYESQVWQVNRKYVTYNRKYGMKKYEKSQVCHLKSQVCYVKILLSQVCFNYRKYVLQYRKYDVVNHVISQV